MEQFEQLLVRHCSPTLAGIKTGNLFNYIWEHHNDLQYQLQKWNQTLNPRGVFLITLFQQKKKSLVYVYRSKSLKQDFGSECTRAYLSSIGYDCCDIEACLEKLASRIGAYDSFPHEIGLFLGYPLEDVKGFIENLGQNCKCCGLWKVYSNESETEKLFAKFKKCTQVYCQCFQKGLSIMRLTVAA